MINQWNVRGTQFTEIQLIIKILLIFYLLTAIQFWRLLNLQIFHKIKTINNCNNNKQNKTL